LSTKNNVLFRKGYTLLNALQKTPEHGFYLSNSFCTDKLWDRLANQQLKLNLQQYHPSTITESHYHQADTDNHLSKILYTDIKTYLSGDILVKVDRMSMANSLEVRAPILDYQVVDFAASIPSSLKLHNGEKKYILKQSFKSRLPSDILYRKKMGFSVPLSDWFFYEIKEFAEQKLFSTSSGLENYFNIVELKKIWNEHQTGKRDYSTILWSFLMFELWWQKYIEP
jgi:asparagine synthase (glutamine-hydrolysing)